MREPRTPEVDAELSGIKPHVNENEQLAIWWTDYECLADKARSLESRLAAARELLQEWLDTELDAQDEEFEPWIASFTERCRAALAATEGK